MTDSSITVQHSCLDKNIPLLLRTVSILSVQNPPGLNGDPISCTEKWIHIPRGADGNRSALGLDLIQEIFVINGYEMVRIVIG